MYFSSTTSIVATVSLKPLHLRAFTMSRFVYGFSISWLFAWLLMHADVCLSFGQFLTKCPSSLQMQQFVRRLASRALASFTSSWTPGSCTSSRDSPCPFRFLCGSRGQFRESGEQDFSPEQRWRQFRLILGCSKLRLAMCSLESCAAFFTGDTPTCLFI